MNKILVEVSVGELLDKLTILEIKKDKIKDAEKLKFINLEYDSLVRIIDATRTPEEIFDEVWKLVNEVRNG